MYIFIAHELRLREAAYVVKQAQMVTMEAK
jgi:hypothetical protein